MDYILNVEPHDNVKGELVGIPMGIMGNALISEFHISHYVKGRIVCCIDDNPIKKGKIIGGVPIVGNRYEIPDFYQLSVMERKKLDLFI